MKNQNNKQKITYTRLKELALKWAPRRFDWQQYYLEGTEKKMEELDSKQAEDLVMSIRTEFIKQEQYDRLTEIANLADQLNVEYNNHYTDRKTGLEHRILGMRRVHQTNACPYGMTDTTPKKFEEVMKTDKKEITRYLTLLKQYGIKQKDIKDIAKKAMELYPTLDANKFVFGNPSQTTMNAIKMYNIDCFREVFKDYLV